MGTGVNTSIALAGFNLLPVANAVTTLNAESLNQAIMPRLTQAMLANTTASIARRVDAMSNGAAQVGLISLDDHRLQLDDKASLADKLEGGLLRKLPAYVDSLEEGTVDWKRMLGNSSFVLPLSAADSGGGSADVGLTVWGSGDYSKLNSQQGLDWDGEVFSFQLGVLRVNYLSC